MTPVRQAALALAVLALAAAAAGCVNPFTPATPEPPSGQGVVEDFATPDGVLTTMEAAIADRGPSGRSAYYDALADSTDPSRSAFYAFHFPPVIDDWRLNAHRDPPPVWDIRLEKLFYDYLINIRPTFTYRFSFSPDNTTSPKDDKGPDDALLHRYYLLHATSGPIEQDLAVGYADLYLRRFNGRWYLVRWEDRVDPAYGVNPSDPDNRSMGWRRLDSTAGIGS
jgi:hypothetical protein